MPERIKPALLVLLGICLMSFGRNTVCRVKLQHRNWVTSRERKRNEQLYSITHNMIVMSAQSSASPQKIRR